jgi:hypothetical protein
VQLFEYRQKPLVNLVALAAFVALALTDRARLARAAALWDACVAVQGAIVLWYMSRRLLVDERGLQQLVLWKLRTRFVAWEWVEEADVYAVLPRRRSARIARAATKPAGPTVSETTIKLIVEGTEPLYLHLGDVKDPSALADLVLSRVRHVART